MATPAAGLPFDVSRICVVMRLIPHPYPSPSRLLSGEKGFF